MIVPVGSELNEGLGRDEKFASFGARTVIGFEKSFEVQAA